MLVRYDTIRSTYHKKNPLERKGGNNPESESESAEF